MNSMRFKTISLRLADLYYRLKGKISLLEIKACLEMVCGENSFYEQEADVFKIAQFLSDKYGIMVR